jgi:hypothetical protein
MLRPTAVAARLGAEAMRQGVSIEAVAVEVLTRNLPAPGGYRLRFVGIDTAGRAGPTDLTRTRDKLAACKLAHAL